MSLPRRWNSEKQQWEPCCTDPFLTGLLVMVACESAIALVAILLVVAIRTTV